MALIANRYKLPEKYHAFHHAFHHGFQLAPKDPAWRTIKVAERVVTIKRRHGATQYAARDGRYVWRMLIPGEWSSYVHMQVIKQLGKHLMIFWVKKVFYVAVAWLPSETAIRTDTCLEVCKSLQWKTNHANLG